MRELWDDGWWWWIKLIQLICLFFTSLVISYMFCFWLKLPKRCSVSVSRIRTDFSCRLFYGSGTNSFPLSCQSGGIPERLRLSDGFPGILGLHAHLGLDIRLFFHLFSAATWAQYGGLKRVQFFWHFPLCDWWKKPMKLATSRPTQIDTGRCGPAVLASQYGRTTAPLSTSNMKDTSQHLLICLWTDGSKCV